MGGRVWKEEWKGVKENQGVLYTCTNSPWGILLLSNTKNVPIKIKIKKSKSVTELRRQGVGPSVYCSWNCELQQPFSKMRSTRLKVKNKSAPKLPRSNVLTEVVSSVIMDGRKTGKNPKPWIKGGPQTLLHMYHCVIQILKRIGGSHIY